MMEMTREVPVKCYYRDIEPIYDDPDNRKEGSEPDCTHTLLFNSVGEYQAREENEEENLHKEPVTVRSVQKGPVVVMGYTYHFQCKIDIYTNPCALPKSKG